jgi:serine protease Do
VVVDTFDGQSVAANVVGADPATDIAVLRASLSIGSGRTLSFADVERQRPGEWVVSVGSPGGLLNAISVGVLSARGRVPNPTLAAQEFIAHLFIDATVVPGDSGGPVLDLDGRVIGVDSAILAGTSLGIVIPGPVVEEIVRGIERYGTFTHGTIGVQVDRGTGSRTTEGILVAGCRPDCALGALKAGDRILAVDGQRVASIAEFERRVFMNPPGAKWLLELMRNGQKIDVAVVLQEMTQDRFVQEQVPASYTSRVGGAWGG